MKLSIFQERGWHRRVKKYVVGTKKVMYFIRARTWRVGREGRNKKWEKYINHI